VEAPRPEEVGAVETVVVDPPREGLDAANLALARLARRRLVYVSCDPQTLGRDAQRLREAGLRLQRAVALDLMPQTYHVEVVASFGREG
jgi:23S rRNA (uracil1939-C5)-methyltransferase